MISFFYNLIITPLVVLYENAYRITNEILFLSDFASYSILISIFVVSVLFNLLTYPLYKKADIIQNEARLKKEKMSKWVEHIKKVFKGDERYFILSTYYKENNYSPLDQLKESLSLLIQIPFFTAAYIFFTSVNYNNETIFQIIPLASEDKLLTIGDISINVLPIIMTIINLVSASIYTRGFKLKDKISSFVLPVLFLIILYRSPSALVLYWTFNNIISLIKIIIIKVSSKRNNQKYKICVDEKENKFNNSFNFINAACFLFIGIIIPSLVISASPNEFNTRFYVVNDFVIHSIVVFAGFALWTAIVYYFSENKKVFLVAMISICVFMILNHTLYMNDNGYISTKLEYDSWGFFFEVKDYMINILYFLIIIIIVSILSIKPKLLNYLSKILCITFAIWSIYLLGSIESSYISYIRNEIAQSKMIKKEDSSRPFINLSKNGENVIFICLDRFIARYYPYALKLRPELKEKFDGFDVYLNTLSFGAQTHSGAPAMFGGYEYTVFEMNKTDEAMSKKTAKAATVIPKILSNEGYNVELIDSHFKTSSIDIENVKNIVFRENVNTTYIEESGENFLLSIKDKFVRYNMMKVAPLFAKNILYDLGQYGIQNAAYLDFEFLSNYAVLDELKNVTNVVNDDNKNAFILHNELTHEPKNLKYPNFDPLNIEGDDLKDMDIIVDGVKFEGNTDQLASTVASLIKVGEYLDYLRANDIYDNTRIIIVGDHGYAYLNDFDHYKGQRDKLDIDEKRYDDIDENFVAAYPQQYNPILMYKDFNKKGYEEKNDFMTNADAPYLTIKDISKDMKNPWTGNEITMDRKNEMDKFNLFTFISIDESNEVYNKNIRMFNRYGYDVTFEGKDVYRDGALSFDYNVENSYCIGNNVHRLVLHKKNDDNIICGDKYKIDVYECEICHKCFKDSDQKEFIFDVNDYKINIPHKFTNYISDNNDSINNHGTKTAECDYGCGTKDTIYDNDINMHHHFVNTLKKADFVNDGFIGSECDKCHLLEPGKEVEVISSVKEIKLENEYVEMTGDKNNAKVIAIDKNGEVINNDNLDIKCFNNDNLGDAYALVALKNNYEIKKDNEIENIYNLIEKDEKLVIRFDYKIVPERVKIKSVEHKRSNLVVSIELGKGRINEVEIVVDDKEDKPFTFKKTEKNEYKVNLTEFNNEAKKIKVRVVRYDNTIGEALYSPWVEGEVE